MKLQLRPSPGFFGCRSCYRAVTAADLAVAERIQVRIFRPSKEAVLSLLREYSDDVLITEDAIETRSEEFIFQSESYFSIRERLRDGAAG